MLSIFVNVIIYKDYYFDEIDNIWFEENKLDVKL